MKPHAADSNKDTKVLTPWESIDPSEPAAVGVVCAPTEAGDEPEAAVYQIGRADRNELPAVERRSTPVEIEVAAETPTTPVERIADNPETSNDLLAEAESNRAAFDPARSLNFDQSNEMPEIGEEPIVNIETTVIANEAGTTGASPRDSERSEESGQISPTARCLGIPQHDELSSENVNAIASFEDVENGPIVSHPSETSGQPVDLPRQEFSQTPISRDASPELFVDVPDALDKLPDSLAPITDISQAIGESQVIAPSVIDLKPLASFAEVDAVMDGDLPYAMESSEASKPTGIAISMAEPITGENFEPEQVDHRFEMPEPVQDGKPDREFDSGPQPVWEDLEMDEEAAPVTTGASWTIPLLCAGIGLIACCVVVPQADANRRLAYEKQALQMDLETVQKQVSVNEEFLKRVVDDPSLSERLAQRQLKRVRKGQRVLQLKDEKQEMSPFQIVNVASPEPLSPYKPASGVIASLCYDPRTRLYTLGAAMIMIACGLVLGSSPIRGVKESKQQTM